MFINTALEWRTVKMLQVVKVINNYLGKVTGQKYRYVTNQSQKLELFISSLTQ